MSVQLHPLLVWWAVMFAVMAHFAIFATAAGRYYGLDGVLRPAWLSWAQASSSRLARLLVRAS